MTALSEFIHRTRSPGGLPRRGGAYPWRSEFFIDNSSGDGEPFVRIRDCKPGVLSPEDLDLLDREYALSQGQAKAHRGDLVVGMDGLKWFYAALLSQPVFVNQRVAIISSIESSTYSSELLLVVLNSVLGQQQLLRVMTIAQTVGHITLDDIRALLLPEIEHGVATRITDCVRKAHSAKAASRLQLERAKRAIELSIEKSEKFALDLLAKGDS